jgi:hypothetical protein
VGEPSNININTDEENKAQGRWQYCNVKGEEKKVWH